MHCSPAILLVLASGLSLAAQSIRVQFGVGSCSVQSRGTWTKAWQEPECCPSGTRGDSPISLPQIRHTQVAFQPTMGGAWRWEVEWTADRPLEGVRSDGLGFNLRRRDASGTSELILGAGIARLDGHQAFASPRYRNLGQSNPVWHLENPEDLRRLHRTLLALTVGMGVYPASSWGVELLVRAFPLPETSFNPSLLQLGVVRLVYRMPPSR